MTDQFVGEIRMFAGNFAPLGWAFCDGQLLSIASNVALFSLLGTTYGGNGTATFALPNLQGMAPIHFGSGASLTPRAEGATGGEAAVTLLGNQIPGHTHPVQASTDPGSAAVPAGNLWAEAGASRGKKMYAPPGGEVALSPLAVGASGGGQAHNNLPPYLVVNFIIALQGIFPSRG